MMPCILVNSYWGFAGSKPFRKVGKGLLRSTSHPRILESSSARLWGHQISVPLQHLTASGSASQCVHLRASWFETQPADKLVSWLRISSVSTYKCMNRNCIWPSDAFSTHICSPFMIILLLDATKLSQVKRLRQVTYEYIHNKVLK